MNKCPKCKSKEIWGCEYAYNCPERYDGISEWQCRACGYRQGRWTGKEIKEGFIESRYGKRVHIPNPEER